MRLRWLGVCAALWWPSAAGGAEPATTAANTHEADFELLWKTVSAEYAYFEGRSIDWDNVRATLAPRARAARHREEFIAVLETALDALHDPHAHLGTNTSASWRLVPSDADLWAEFRNEEAVIVEVRAGSAAERDGIRAGMPVVTVDGETVAEAVRARMNAALVPPTAEARDWALRSVLAGRHDRPRALRLRDGTVPLSVVLDGVMPAADPARRRLEWRRLAGEIGYIRPRNSLGDTDLIEEYDAALVALEDTRGMIVDLRDTPSGGNTTVLRGLVGRLLTQEMPYQKHDLPMELRRYGVAQAWVEHVLPRGPFPYRAPMVALVGHWTGSVGEAVAIALDGTKRAIVVGTPMAGLKGATTHERLPGTGIGMNLPTERLFHVDGTPRERFQPRVFVDLLDPSVRASADPVLDAGLRRLQEEIRALARTK